MRVGLICLLVLFISACNYDDHAKEHPVYFELTTYFKQEAARLTHKNLVIDKTVSINDKAEQKKIKINNWEQEFSSFIDADINKASWKGSFTLVKKDQLEIYTSQSKKIPVKKLEIAYENENIKSIKVFIVNKNDLYNSNDSLSYYPDSLYEIKKTQKIKLMTTKRYSILGKFK